MYNWYLYLTFKTFLWRQRKVSCSSYVVNLTVHNSLSWDHFERFCYFMNQCTQCFFLSKWKLDKSNRSDYVTSVFTILQLPKVHDLQQSLNKMIWKRKFVNMNTVIVHTCLKATWPNTVKVSNFLLQTNWMFWWFFIKRIWSYWVKDIFLLF